MRRSAHVASWIAALVFGSLLAACGQDEHKGHQGHEAKSGDTK
jgi:hypothetical protein